MATIAELRNNYHRSICLDIIRAPKNYPNFADGSNRSSCAIAWNIVKRLNLPLGDDQLSEQAAGGRFERITLEFIQSAFAMLANLRPGDWHYSTTQTAITGFEQYEHLAYLGAIISRDKYLASILGGDYIVKPDIIIGRVPVSDNYINQNQLIISAEEQVASLTPIRSNNRSNSKLILHASISCKWTIRSDRSQNTRTEALNLIRNRKGPLPHIVAITAEPLPTRIASLALGTGDLDCVYHFALPELKQAIIDNHNEDQLDMLISMIEGRRLRDISDLPFDLAI